MKRKTQHHSHSKSVLRLKRAQGHLLKVIQMIEEGEGCLKLAQQLFAVEKAITQAKKVIIHDHIEHCLEDGSNHSITEFKDITKYL